MATHKGGDEKTVYGSVYFYNLASVVWEVVADHTEDNGALRVALFCRKNNLGPRPKPIGLTFTFAGEVCTMTTSEIAESPTLSEKLSRSQRILHVLSDHAARSVQEIAEFLDDDHNAIRVELNRHKGKLWHKIEEDWIKL